MKLSLPTIGLLQAAGLTLYITSVAKLFQYGGAFFGSLDTVKAATFFLLLFVVSALISALLILGYPLFLFFGRKRKEALEIVSWSTLWLVGFLAILLIVL